ncbi:class I SAM-dependent methyltransferase [Tsuneonella sp. SYSU-LHT278]|uniref:class I SAM-dependent methyltransferase n=1 Tax=Tsuneonella sediminis TaxID=3416089 RepID=UPI003F79D787
MPPEAGRHPAYDTIGIDYARLRRADPRIAALIEVALGSARTVLNVGAGAGSYEPPGRAVTALEPSAEMIAQRPAGAAPCVQGVAEDLPFADQSFDAAMGVLTIHHWPDPARGLAEMRRVARGPVVLLTFDPECRAGWILDYWPQLAELDAAIMPEMALYEEVLGPVETVPVPIAHDCTDGFLHAYWRRPKAYLDPAVRRSMSSFWRIDGAGAGLDRLAEDLRSGAWTARYGDLLLRESFDAGYRLVISR